MEKIFTPNKVFVGFCALLILVWLSLQYVSNEHLAERAKFDGRRIFEWQWPENHLKTKTSDLAAKVLRRSGTDATVQITGKQSTCSENSATEVGKTTDCQAVLTYYHTDKQWVLGKVELK